MPTASDNREFVEEVMSPWPLDDAVEFIQKRYSPDEVFSTEDLDAWARDNGYRSEMED